MCEGAFSPTEDDERDRLILAGVRRALRPGGLLVLETSNALYQIVRNLDAATFDVETLRERFALQRTAADGTSLTVECTQRYYTCPELRTMLEGVGFRRVRFYGGFDRSPLARGDFNMVMVAVLPDGRVSRGRGQAASASVDSTPEPTDRGRRLSGPSTDRAHRPRSALSGLRGKQRFA